MKQSTAVALLAPAVKAPWGVWADLGAGSGTFTRALATLLGPRGRVIAVERTPAAVASLRALAVEGAEISVVAADFTEPLELPVLDGALFANALHFVSGEEQERVLRDMAARLGPRGRIVVVEYDGRSPSRWVPYPIARAQFGELAARVGLGRAAFPGALASAFGGTMYAAYAVKLPPSVERGG